MLPIEFLVPLMLGAVLAFPYVAVAHARVRPRVLFGVGLIVAALVYVVFALAAGDIAALMLEAGGVVIFAVFAAIGLRVSAYWLVAGWLGHVAWDVMLHPVAYPGYAPAWYPPLCIGFDVLVAGFCLALLWPPAQPAAGESPR